MDNKTKRLVADEILASVNWVMSSGELSEEQVAELMKIRDNAKMLKDDVRYSVWVGGVEVNDYELDIEAANRLADKYLADGYDDVQVEEIQH